MPKIDPDDESERLLSEIEAQYPPDKCSLEEYKEVLEALMGDLKTRVRQLHEEIG